MNRNVRTNRRRSRAFSRQIAHNLRTAARSQHLTLSDVRSIEQDNHMHPGTLLLTFAGLRVMVTHVLVLQNRLGLSVDDLFADTRHQDVRA